MPAGYHKNGIKMIPPSRKGIKDSKETRLKKSIRLKMEWKNGKRTLPIGLKHYTPHTEESKKKMSQSHKGNLKSIETRKKLSRALKGAKSYLWKGGITSINYQIRHSLEYKLWRESIFQRDNYTCVWCGQRGGVLNADHIKPFSLFPELRFAIDNGRTLCRECHKTTDTFGERAKKYKL